MKKSQLFKTEYFVYFFILLIPIFDFIFNQYIEIIEITSYIKLNSIKLVIPILLLIYLFFKAKGREKLQFALIVLGYLIYSILLTYHFENKLLSDKISIEEYFFKFKQIVSLTVFVINFFIMYKVFYRKNMTKLRMSYNYAATIYLLSVLLLSLTSQDIKLYDNLSLIILMLSFIVLTTLTYKKDQAFSLFLLVSLITFYITMVNASTAYYSFLIIFLTYIFAIIIEKIIKRESIFAVIKLYTLRVYSYLIKTFSNINISRNKLKRLGEGSKTFKNKKIKGFDKKVFLKRKTFIKKEVLEYDKNENSNYKQDKSKNESSVLKDIRKRVRLNKRNKRIEKLKKIFENRIVKTILFVFLIILSVFILFLNYKYINKEPRLNINIKENLIYLVYIMPLIIIIIKSIIFTIFNFKRIDREFILLFLLLIYILILFLSVEAFSIDFSCAVIISTILLIILNKIETNVKEEYVITANNKKIKTKRIVFGITNLTISGLSRILVDITNSLDKKYLDLDINIFTIFGGGEFEEEVGVKIISLFKKPFTEYNNFSRFLISLYLKAFEPNIFNKYIRGNYDVMIAFDEKDVLQIFSYSDDARKIAWVHNKNYGLINPSHKKERKRLAKLYTRYEHLIFTREIALAEFNKIFVSKRMYKNKKSIISNYVDPVRIFLHSESEEVYEWTDDTVSLLTVVRLYKHKALDRFIRTHKKLLEDGLEHQVYIIGDGPEKENLIKLIRQEKLQQSVFLLGSKTNPYPYIKKATYFCLFSEKEDYSIVLNEAKILNKDILITDTTTRDLVIDYPNVRIFENSESGLYNGLKYVLSTRNLTPKQSEYIYKNEEILRKIVEILI